MEDMRQKVWEKNNQEKSFSLSVQVGARCVMLIVFVVVLCCLHTHTKNDAII